MLTHVMDTIFRAGVFRSMHFAPLWLAALIAIAIGAALLWRVGRSRW